MANSLDPDLLKGYCTVFQHALKPMEKTGVVFSKACQKMQGKKFQRV